jgi:hypothetical protein
VGTDETKAEGGGSPPQQGGFLITLLSAHDKLRSSTLSHTSCHDVLSCLRPKTMELANHALQLLKLNHDKSFSLYELFMSDLFVVMEN